MFIDYLVHKQKQRTHEEEEQDHIINAHFFILFNFITRAQLAS